MRLRIPYDDEQFASVFIPRLVNKYVNNLYLKEITKKMDSYLNLNYGVSLNEILHSFLANMSVYKSGGIFILEANKNEYMPNTSIKYEMFIRLIDNGNLEVKGLHLVDTTYNYFKNHMYFLYEMYAKGGL